MSLKCICAGLSRTGTTSFHNAMEVLGYRSLHHDTERLWEKVCLNKEGFDFRVYDDIDAISDLPAPIYLFELLEAYPEAKVVLTIRNTDDWWKSVNSRFSKKPVKPVSPIGKMALRAGFSWWPRMRYDKSRVFKNTCRELAYGSAAPNETEYKKRYADYNNKVESSVAKERLLVMNICEGDGWQQLCPFLGLPIPEQPFPCSNTH